MSKMQKLNLIIAFFIMLVFVSCGKDDEPYNPLIGTWEYTDTYEAVSMKFNKNHNFSIDGEFYNVSMDGKYYDVVYYMKGKYEIYDKDKVFFHCTDVSSNVKIVSDNHIDTFKIYRDCIGKYLILNNQVCTRYYKK